VFGSRLPWDDLATLVIGKRPVTQALGFPLIG